MEKWDSYLSVLLGILLIIVLKAGNPQLLIYFRYFVLIMIAVVIFDTLSNFAQHESLFWKFAAIASNGVVLLGCIYILQVMYKMLPSLSFPKFQFMMLPNFMIYMGIFLIIENLFWIFVYDHL